MRYKRDYRSRVKSYLTSEAAKILEIIPQLEGDDIIIARNKLIMFKRLAMRAGIRLDKKYNRLLCKKCGGLLIPGKSLRVRVKCKRHRHVTYTCLNCGYMRRVIIETARS
ncbi:MAG: ribonuclease P Rpr2/Rpp21/SNM1 subunit [Candidatus Odinarchaeota archaeon]